MPINAVPKIVAPTRSPESPEKASVTMKTNFNRVQLPQKPKVAAPAPTETAQPSNPIEQPIASTEAPSQPISPQYASLARKEAALRKAQQELKSAQDAWKSRESDYIPKSRLQEDALAALAEAGITYDKLTELQLGKGEQPETNPLQSEIDALKKRLEKYEGDLTERDKRAYDSAVGQIRSDVKLLVDFDPTFETIKATESSEQVVELITKVFESEGIVLTVEDAATQVEDALLERTVASVKKLSQLEKIKAKLAPTPEPVQPQETRGSTPKTLTNAVGSTRPLTAREKAILAYEGRK
jgi:hypothetical protein